jgi:4a-hydroxytetrahydrobiopterin dehydratase
MMWQEKDGALMKSWDFPDFSAAWAFASRVALVCEKQDHHADILVGWGRVVVTSTTHEASNRVTSKDWALAQTLDALK